MMASDTALPSIVAGDNTGAGFPLSSPLMSSNDCDLEVSGDKGSVSRPH